MDEAYYVTCEEDSFEMMIRYPNGSVKFHGLWETIKICYRLIRAKKIVYLNGEKI